MATRAAARIQLSDRLFFGGAAATLLILVGWGFGPSFFWTIVAPSPRPTMLTDRGPAAHALFLVHGLAFTAWMVLYGVQSSLITARRTALHRRLGQTMIVLAPVVTLLGVIVAVAGLLVGFHGLREVPRAAFATASVVNSLNFGAFAWLGYRQRRAVAAHKRWLLLATMVLTGAAVARIDVLETLFPGWLDPTAVLLPALAAWDVATLRRVHPVTLYGGLIYLALDVGTSGPVLTSVWHLAA